MGLSYTDQCLIAAIQDGLPICHRPYQLIGFRLGWTESAVISALDSLLSRGVIKRMGVVVRHRNLGYRANAMVVLSVPEDIIKNIAAHICQNDIVTLCYRRQSHPPRWPYNLFFMVHGQDKQQIKSEIDKLLNHDEITNMKYAILFSKQCFKQCGAHYIDTTDIEELKNTPADYINEEFVA